MILGLIALAYALWGEVEPLGFFGADASPYRIVPWSLALAGALFRMWGAGNLAKNQGVTRTGVYRMVRHPLYLGNCLIYLGFLLALDGLLMGSFLFLCLLVLLHYPPMLQEEARLARDYPQQLEAMKGTPRLLPNPLRIREALATDRFSLERVRRNYGFRGFWGPVLLPLFAEGLIMLRSYL